jgi:hypothetical protein
MPLKVARRTATEVIERSPLGPERVYFKSPLRGPVDITLRSTMDSVSSDIRRLEALLWACGRKTYVGIHTHPFASFVERPAERCMPSTQDLYAFMSQSEQRTMVIAARDVNNGTVFAYSFTRKTRKTPKIESVRDLDQFELLLNPLLSFEKHVQKVIAEYHLQHRVFDIRLRNVSGTGPKS